MIHIYSKQRYNQTVLIIRIKDGQSEELDLLCKFYAR